VTLAVVFTISSKNGTDSVVLTFGIKSSWYKSTSQDKLNKVYSTANHHSNLAKQQKQKLRIYFMKI